MITLDSIWSYVGMLVLAGLFGALGGVAYELLQSRGKDNETGWFENPHKRNDGYYDAGSASGIIVGAIAAMAAMYFFPPAELVSASTVTPPAMQYNFTKLLALSLIVGSAGSSFLNAMQARVKAALEAQTAETTKDVGKQQAATLADASSAIAEGVVAEVVARYSDQVQDVVRKSAEAMPLWATDVLGKHTAQLPDLELLLKKHQMVPEPERRINEIAKVAAAEARELVKTRTAQLVEGAQKTIDAAARA